MAQVVRATEVENAIEEAIAKDQGRAFRRFLGQVIMNSPDAFRDEEDGFRSHMGASIMGGKCGRAIWYNFHWATKPNFPGRVLRLFNRGHLEEPRLIASLMCIGATIFQVDANGKQYRISGSGGHYGGSGDGIGTNIIGLQPGMYCVLEFKTHNDASFKTLVKEGVRSAKFEHFVQMQQYMRKMGLTVALYMAVNKNDDSIYAEWVMLEYETADTFIDRADKIVWLKRAPDRIGSPPSPGNWDCKWCDHKPVCFLKVKPAMNCRTCAHSNAVDGGEAIWVCNKYHVHLSKAQQEVGCTSYEQHPDMGS
jgi:hypothetical protein